MKESSSSCQGRIMEEKAARHFTGTLEHHFGAGLRKLRDAFIYLKVKAYCRISFDRWWVGGLTDGRTSVVRLSNVMSNSTSLISPVHYSIHECKTLLSEVHYALCYFI